MSVFAFRICSSSSSRGTSRSSKEKPLTGEVSFGSWSIAGRTGLSLTFHELSLRSILRRLELVDLYSTRILPREGLSSAWLLPLWPRRGAFWIECLQAGLCNWQPYGRRLNIWVSSWFLHNSFEVPQWTGWLCFSLERLAWTSTAQVYIDSDKLLAFCAWKSLKFYPYRYKVERCEIERKVEDRNARKHWDGLNKPIDKALSIPFEA